MFNPFFSTYQMNSAGTATSVDYQVGSVSEFAVLNGNSPGALTLVVGSSPLTFQAGGGEAPEPSTFILLGAGLVGMMVMRRKSRMK